MYLSNIAYHLADSPDDRNKYVLSQSFTKRELVKLAKGTYSFSPIRELVTKKLLERNPTFYQLCHLLKISSAHFPEVVDRIVKFPNPSARQVEKVSYLFQLPSFFWASNSCKNRPAVIKLGQYILAHSNTPKHLMGVYDHVKELEDKVLDTWCQSSFAVDKESLLFALLYRLGKDSRPKLGERIASLPHLPLEVLAVLASNLYGRQECWDAIKLRQDLSAEDFNYLLSPFTTGCPDYYDDYDYETYPNPPAYFDEVLRTFYSLQPKTEELAEVLLRYPSYGEATVKQLLSRQPDENIIERVFRHNDHSCHETYRDFHGGEEEVDTRFSSTVCELLAEYVLEQKQPTPRLLAIATAYTHTFADRLYTTFLTSSPKEGDFRLLIRLGGVKEKDAAITLLDRYPTLENANFLTEYLPDLTLYALASVEHSRYEVMAATRDIRAF